MTANDTTATVENLLAQYIEAKDAYWATQGGTKDPSWIKMGEVVAEADRLGLTKQFTKAVAKSAVYK